MRQWMMAGVLLMSSVLGSVALGYEPTTDDELLEDEIVERVVTMAQDEDGMTKLMDVQESMPVLLAWFADDERVVYFLKFLSVLIDLIDSGEYELSDLIQSQEPVEEEIEETVAEETEEIPDIVIASVAAHHPAKLYKGDTIIPISLGLSGDADEGWTGSMYCSVTSAQPHSPSVEVEVEIDEFMVGKVTEIDLIHPYIAVDYGLYEVSCELAYGDVELGQYCILDEDRLCSEVENTCGDGLQASREYCDDGNVFDGDGCSSTCVVEQFIVEDCRYGIVSALEFSGVVIDTVYDAGLLSLLVMHDDTYARWENGGASWSEVDLGDLIPDGAHVELLYHNGTTYVAVTDDNLVQVHYRQGDIWKQVGIDYLMDNDIAYVEMAVNSSNRLVLSLVDDTQTWRLIELINNEWEQLATADEVEFTTHWFVERNATWYLVGQDYLARLHDDSLIELQEDDYWMMGMEVIDVLVRQDSDIALLLWNDITERFVIYLVRGDNSLEPLAGKAIPRGEFGALPILQEDQFGNLYISYVDGNNNSYLMMHDGAQWKHAGDTMFDQSADSIWYHVAHDERAVLIREFEGVRELWQRECHE